MKRHAPLAAGLSLAAAVAMGLAACETQPQPADDTGLDTAGQPGLTGDTAAMPEAIYEASLEGVDGSGITGTATVTLRDDELQVTVAATGVDPNTRVPQHIHVNATCDNAGGILLNLDDGLTLAGQGEPRGDAYPETNDQGTLRYEASRSLPDFGTGMESDTAALGDAAASARAQGGMQAASDSLNLGERVVNLHGPDMQPIACGELERTGQTNQAGQSGQAGQTGT